MLNQNSYFDDQVQSVGFERNGLRASVGAIAPGTYRFDTAAPERMTVVSGVLFVKLPAAEEFSRFPAGTYFEVPGESAFEVRVDDASAYLCEYF